MQRKLTEQQQQWMVQPQEAHTGSLTTIKKGGRVVDFSTFQRRKSVHPCYDGLNSYSYVVLFSQHGWNWYQLTAPNLRNPVSIPTVDDTVTVTSCINNACSFQRIFFLWNSSRVMNAFYGKSGSADGSVSKNLLAYLGAV
jgi:hypothetical protein